MGYEKDSRENQKTDISSISVKSRMSYLTWGVILCRMISTVWIVSVPSGKVDDERDKNEYVRIEGQRGRGWSGYALIE